MEPARADIFGTTAPYPTFQGALSPGRGNTGGTLGASSSDALHGFKVGIVIWQGNPTQKDDRSRSVPLAQFAPLAEVPGVKLISLQVGAGCGPANEASPLPGSH